MNYSEDLKYSQSIEHDGFISRQQRVYNVKRICYQMQPNERTYREIASSEEDRREEVGEGLVA